MRTCGSAFLAAAVAAAVATTSAAASQYEAWKTHHGVSFATPEEDALRRSIFNANLAMIDSHNANVAQGKVTWSMALNEFAHLSHSEFLARYVGGSKPRAMKVPHYELAHLRTDPADLPSSVDWTKRGVVTPVKNQGQCGSCWSFSTTGSVESITAIKTGKLVSLSEQELMDCSGAYGNQGCNGGWPSHAMEYVAKYGLCAEKAYPYEGRQGSCRKAKCDAVAHISGHRAVPEHSEDALMSALTKQPVSIVIQANQPGFQFYHAGVYNQPCGHTIDHAVLAVGYGTEDSEGYFKVKNSWGASWGMDGYVLLGRGQQYAPYGQCGILTGPVYPVKQ